MRSSIYTTLPGYNLEGLKNTDFWTYCSQIPNFNVILKKLRELNLSTIENEDASNYSITDFLSTIKNQEILHFSASEILKMPFKESPTTHVNAQEPKEIPRKFVSLTRKIDFYLLLIVDVLNNELAKTFYEAGVEDSENVTEKLHALEAAKIAYLMGFSMPLVIAMLLHDDARVTTPDAGHGHKYHCVEGSKINAPLGLPTDYSLYHALAKYLLKESCELYSQTLISPTSEKSLIQQVEQFESLVPHFKHLELKDLVQTIYLIMTLRLIDDFSKVPKYALKNTETGKNPSYFDNDVIMTILRDQLTNHLHDLSNNRKHENVCQIFEEKLDAALSLLLRAQKFTRNKSIYETYADIVEEIVKKTPSLIPTSPKMN